MEELRFARYDGDDDDDDDDDDDHDKCDGLLLETHTPSLPPLQLSASPLRGLLSSHFDVFCALLQLRAEEEVASAASTRAERVLRMSNERAYGTASLRGGGRRRASAFSFRCVSAGTFATRLVPFSLGPRSAVPSLDDLALSLVQKAEEAEVS